MQFGRACLGVGVTMRRSFRTHRFRMCRPQGFTLGWYAMPRWGTSNTHSTTPRGTTQAAKRDLGRSAPGRRTPHPLARSAKADPFRSLLSARRPWSRGARTRDAPFEGLADRAMRRSFRTHRFCVSHTQGFTLGWYAVPRWGTPEIRLTTPHCSTPHCSTPHSSTPHSSTLDAAGPWL